MSRFTISDVDSSKEIQFQATSCEEPDFNVVIIISDNENDDNYTYVKVPLKELVKAIEWCKTTEFIATQSEARRKQ